MAFAKLVGQRHHVGPAGAPFSEAPLTGDEVVQDTLVLANEDGLRDGGSPRFGKEGLPVKVKRREDGFRRAAGEILQEDPAVVAQRERERGVRVYVAGAAGREPAATATNIVETREKRVELR